MKQAAGPEYKKQFRPGKIIEKQEKGKMKEQSGIKIYGYRWVILAVFALITILIEIQWVAHASIAREARVFYNVEQGMIDLLAVVYMAVFLLLCFPASHIIEKYGIRVGIGIGAVLTGVFGLMKGFYAADYTMVLIAQIGLAVAQPFILNATTKVAVRWFPINERATAVGVATLAQFIAFIIVMLATPRLIAGEGGEVLIEKTMMLYGILSAAAAVITLVLLKERPATPPSHEEEEDRFMFREGVRNLFKQKDYVKTLAIFFIGLGMFNAIVSLIDPINEMKGISMVQSGYIMAAMMGSGIVGALVLPLVSDKLRKRKPILLFSMLLMLPGLVGMTLAGSYTVMLVFSTIFGFFLLGGAAPVGFQYAAEISFPTPESTSQGFILWAGQISGMLFVIGMDSVGIQEFMYGFIGLSVIILLLILGMKESPMIQQAGKE
jgi:MFS family permease